MGWRPVRAPLVSYSPHTTDPADLFKIARLASRALGLPAGCRFVLDQLCAAYRGQLVEGRMLVWPSNAFLVEKTGLAERTVRVCLAQLIAEGLIQAKDSPNGKRYAERRGDAIVRAFGFDLGPMLARMSEFKDRIVAIEERERENLAGFDQITIHRRFIASALETLRERGIDVERLGVAGECVALTGDAPRRSARVSPLPCLALWKSLRERVDELLKDSGSGGSFCRHKDTNTKSPESLCSSHEQLARAEPTVAEALAAVPDAMELVGVVQSERELLDRCERLRGSLGVSKSAWMEARGLSGDLGACLVLLQVVQRQSQRVGGSREIRNLGGYFRALSRSGFTAVPG